MKKCAKCGCICDDATNFCTVCGSNQFEAVETAVQDAASDIEAAAENLNEAAGNVEGKTAAAVEEIKNEAAQPVPGTDRPVFVPVTPVQPEAEMTPPKDITKEKNEKPEKSTKPVSTGLFFLFDILVAIPLVGLVLTLVFSAFAKNLNVQHYWKAKLIRIIIVVVIAVIMAILGLIFREQLTDSLQPLINAIQKALNA